MISYKLILFFRLLLSHQRHSLVIWTSCRQAIFAGPRLLLRLVIFVIIGNLISEFGLGLIIGGRVPSRCSYWSV